MIYRGPDGDTSGRFCGLRCRTAYDQGLRYRPASVRYTDSGGDPLVIAGALGRPLQTTRAGFLIQCRGCFKEFDNTGLAFCSPDCERKAKDRREAEAVAAEIGHEVRQGPVCEGCGGKIPRYTKTGRATQKGARFCSAKCRQRAQNHRAGSSVPKGPDHRDHVQEVPVPQQLRNGVSWTIGPRDWPLSGSAARKVIDRPPDWDADAITTGKVVKARIGLQDERSADDLQSLAKLRGDVR
jgi:ribosomal protein L24E